MAGELDSVLFSIDLYGWGARICLDGEIRSKLVLLLKKRFPLEENDMHAVPVVPFYCVL